MNTPETTHPEEVAVRRLGQEGAELAVFEFQGALRDSIVTGLRDGFFANGNYLPEAKAVSSQGAISLALAGTSLGATGISAAYSSKLYMATANPATLMKIGDGVSTAVMGSTGIVRHAPFVAVSSALPVVAPILAMQALSTAVMMQQFKQVDQKLDAIKTTLDKAIARIEATHAGQLLAASWVVDDIYEQYELEGSFSQDMLVRLALAERDIKALAARFRQLVEARLGIPIHDLDEVQQTNYDAHSAMLASFVDLRISYLRVCVNMQENPKSVGAAMESLKTAIDDGIVFWQQLQDRSSSLKSGIQKLEEKLEDMNWASRRIPGVGASAVERERDALKDAYTTTIESEKEIMRDFHSLIDSAQATRDALDAPAATSSFSSPTLVYWRDETGEHSFVTEQNLISA